ncbi:MAG: purine-nucleoside phosphorylase [Anaerolineae bacterium]|nr:purine-nucleoside phosphorylase [Anaerolineae bacterium]
MSIHIGAKEGEIADTVLMPGDPLRAKYFADTFLKDHFCFNQVRGMLGFTGTYEGKRVSVMGSGMGIPSFSIYANELLEFYGVKRIIRVGTCGSMQPGMKIGDLVLAMSASTDSNVNRMRFHGLDYAPTADFDLLVKAHQAAKALTDRVFVGGVISGDLFYSDDKEWHKVWVDYGILAAEMETAGLYTLAAKYRAQALAILTVSDTILGGEEAPAEQREKGFSLMAEVALKAASA